MCGTGTSNDVILVLVYAEKQCVLFSRMATVGLSYPPLRAAVLHPAQLTAPHCTEQFMHCLPLAHFLAEQHDQIT
jgi:hypothetical protein